MPHRDALDKAFWATKVEQKPGSQQPGVTDTDKDDKDNKGDVCLRLVPRFP